MKYNIDIRKEQMKSIADKLGSNGFNPSEYSVTSYRPLDERDTRSEEKRTVTLDDGSKYIQPQKRRRDVVHTLTTNNKDLYDFVKSLR